MKITSSCLLGVCLLAWTTGCGTTGHGRCVDWDCQGCPGWEAADECNSSPKLFSKFKKTKCKRHGDRCSGGRPGCEMAPCCGQPVDGWSGPMGQPYGSVGTSSNCCGGESAMVGGMMPLSAMPGGPVSEAGGCAGCAGGQVSGGQVMMAPQMQPMPSSGNCATCGTPANGAPVPPTVGGWNASGSYGNLTSNGAKAATSGCATGNCQSQVIGQPQVIGQLPMIGEGIVYDNVTSPPPMPVYHSTGTPVTSAALQNAPPPPPPPLPSLN
ncbi:MAG: hypothetical protein HZA46_09580 [Planctomycetales bacterium]|nr:hypothetical protein [Planctomycetales bacterium]